MKTQTSAAEAALLQEGHAPRDVKMPGQEAVECLQNLPVDTCLPHSA